MVKVWQGDSLPIADWLYFIATLIVAQYPRLGSNSREDGTIEPAPYYST